MSYGMPSESEGVDQPETGSNATRARRKWTKEEDEKLRLLVSTWGDRSGRQSNWDKIASCFEARTSKDCRKRWIRSLDPKLRHGKWSPSEDRILIEAHERFGTAWQRIAQLIPGRTDDQCAKRYNDVLDPSVQDRLRPWQKEEDEKLLALHAEYGARWQQISKELQGRTGLVCRNRFRKLARPRSREAPVAARVEETAFDDQNPARGEIQYNVPGTTQSARYPAGAERSWFTPTSPDASSVSAGSASPPSLNEPNLLTRSYTISVDNAEVREPVHYELSDALLDKILRYASQERQEIHIHQHIYNRTVPVSPHGSAPLPLTHPPGLPSPLSRPSSQATVLPVTQTNSSAPGPVPQGPAAVHANNVPTAQLPQPRLPDPRIGLPPPVQTAHSHPMPGLPVLPQHQQQQMPIEPPNVLLRPMVPHMHIIPVNMPQQPQQPPAPQYAPVNPSPNERLPQPLNPTNQIQQFPDELDVEDDFGRPGYERPPFGFSEAPDGIQTNQFENDDLNFMAFNPS